MSGLSAAAANADPVGGTGLVLLPARPPRPRLTGESSGSGTGPGEQDTSSDARILQLRLVRPASDAGRASRGAIQRHARPGAVRQEAVLPAAVRRGADQRGVARQEPGRMGTVVQEPGRQAAARPGAVWPGAVRPDATGRAASWRLTRRGRAVLAVLTVLAAVLALWLGTAARAQASGHGQPAGSGYRGLVRVVVQPGQTLWSIAAAAEPSARTAAVIQQIVDANSLRSGTLYAGQLLWVPRH